MQNSFLIIIAAIVIAGGGYILLMNSGGEQPTSAIETTTPTADTTMSEDTMAEPMATPEPAPQPNIVETAVAADDFTTLVTAVTAAELAEVLAGPGPFTVFAPTDAAFAALPAGTVDTLLLPDSQSDLANILTYHVVPGIVTAADLADGLTAETVNGATLTFSIDAAAGTAMVNDANIVAADIEASNGIIHVIDTVLIPAAE
jgi:uncharacterized surface protein with fasciclin (FAS1) repeats